MKEPEADDFPVRRLQLGEGAGQVQPVRAQARVFTAAVEGLDGELWRPAEPRSPMRSDHVPGDTKQPRPGRQSPVLERLGIPVRLLEHITGCILGLPRVTEPRKSVAVDPWHLPIE